MNSQLYCPDETRKALIRAENVLNAIDYLEVLDSDAPPGSPPQQTLLVHCFKPVAGLSKDNVRIDGGVRVSPVRVLWAHPDDNVLEVRTDQPGDFSTYTLRLIESQSQPDEPPAGFDRMLSWVDFSFKVDCPSDFDCKKRKVAPVEALSAPRIDYLAKDYASFRRLMFDRLALLMPDWKERNPADLGVTLVELLAYAADQLSYYQDAVATEAYLGTARRRTSVRRHARLLDYFISDGSNARAWVSLDVEPLSLADGATLPAGTRVLSGEETASSGLAIVFETLHPIKLRAGRSAVPLYTWRNTGCCLPRGATRATLEGSAADLELHKGDVLILEEIAGPRSGRPEDADPGHRHAVRLDAEPEEHTDLSNGKQVLEVRWHDEDALPFPLCLRQFEASGNIRHSVVARANVVLADHGLRIENEELPQVAGSRRYRPQLERTGLSHAMPYEHDKARKRPAVEATRVDPRQVKPWAFLHADGEEWKPRRDLLNSDRFATEFVVEMENDGRACLRFGDNVLGRQPTAGTQFRVTCRVGNGSAGNVGAGSLTRVSPGIAGIRRVCNPLPASGGADPESIERVRLNAPHAFRTQERAVTEADYAAAAQRHRQVQRAAATRRWTGSWYTWFLTVDRKRGRSVDAAFEADLRAFLERFRLAGYDLEIDAPHFVPLDVLMDVCVAPGFYRGSVREALLDAFSNRDLPDGRRGFFHPDNFTFGQTVYLSHVVAAAMKVPGVAWVQTTRFQRWREESRGELDDGRITFGRLEIARLDNDPNAPENGRIDFLMQGGL